jgi:hypothetical integral membrane protein (TIGR02206 family)
MSEYFTLTYTGAPFQPFAPPHLIAILTVIAINVLLVAFLRRPHPPQRLTQIRYALIVLSILNLLAWQLWQLAVGVWSIAASLPLQLCTLAGVLSIPLLIWKPYRLYELLYFWGLAGSGHALLTPDLQIYGFPHFLFWQFFCDHGTNITVVLFLTVSEGYRPHWRSIGWTVLITSSYMLVIGLVNWLSGGNYLYLARKPASPTLIDYLGSWPWYILGLELVDVLSCIVCYLPFAIRDGLAARRRTGAVGRIGSA